jgi:signal transduction histidine kinase
MAFVPIAFENRRTGILKLACRTQSHFSMERLHSFEDVAMMIGVALAHQEAQWALRERIKELTCLYGISKVVQEPGITMEEIIQGIVELLPPGWHYPDITEARIELDGKEYRTKFYRDTPQRQDAPIHVKGAKRGSVQVLYTEERPEIDEGPFLKEERNLIDEVARQVGLIIEQREAELEKEKLQDQLRHADRLATIGQLAAGAAHELNEPISTILGFAQLVKKEDGPREQVLRDLQKIENASLHAREVIRKLLIFARQTPSRMSLVNINDLILEGLYFLESRCAKERIRIEKSLAENLPLILADSSQIHQVLVNIMVNAIQAMPGGGSITVTTCRRDEEVILAVEDTGSGMSKEVMDQIFIPFYTTKEVGQGTGLGLPVVHGIVTGHGGLITVESEVGAGTRFEIKFPKADPRGEKEGTAK